MDVDSDPHDTQRAQKLINSNKTQDLSDCQAAL